MLYGGRAWGCEEMLGVGVYVMQNMRVCMGERMCMCEIRCESGVRDEGVW